ncbi:MAG: sigma-70 factor domain-containing protein, partial [Alkalispirochaeta sp.]
MSGPTVEHERRGKGAGQRATVVAVDNGYDGDTDPLAFYLKQISSYPLLDVHQEQEIG